MSFNKLLEPVRLGQMELKNRIVMPGMGSNLGTEEGEVTEEMVAYFEARARGGTGLIIVGVVDVDRKTGRHQIRKQSLDHDRFIAGWSELTAAIKRHGARSAVQLHHAGRSARQQFVPVPVAASPIPRPGRPMPRALEVTEIAEIVNRFGQAAKRAQLAGFDGIEIHAAHGYLIANFLSAASNIRQDQYGGDLQNRARLLLEIIKSVRDNVGSEFPVWCRINGREYGIERGITIEEAKQVANMIEQAGVNAIHVSAQGWPPAHTADGPLVHFPGHLLPLAHEIKQVVNIPVITAGRISPKLGQKAIQEEKTDLISFGRPLIADPELANKLMSGRAGDINNCLYCGMCVEYESARMDRIRCTVNPAAGMENKYKIEPVKAAKNVMVIGGGPGGMQAAIIAAKRGHQVTLYEKGVRLGGGLNIVGILNSEMAVFRNYLNNQVKRNGLKVILNHEITAKKIATIKPDVVILALGSSLVPPNIPGIEKNDVITGTDIRQMMTGNASRQGLLWLMGSFILRRIFKPSLIRQLTRIWMPFGQRIIIIGGDRVGLETAEFLVERGRKITVVDSDEDEMGDGIPYYLRPYLLHKLEKAGVTMLSGVSYKEITDRGLVIRNKDGSITTIESDNIIIATEAKPTIELSLALKDLVPQVFLIGDCQQPRGILEAVSDGASVGRTI